MSAQPLYNSGSDEEHNYCEEDSLLIESEGVEELKKQIKFPSCRHVVAFVCFLGFTNVYALRVNLSVAIVAMVNSSYATEGNVTNHDCPGQDPIETNTTSSQTGEFNWDSNLQGYILGSFFYGYIATQLPGGRLAEEVGGKWLFGLGVLCTAVLTLLTPIAARAGPYYFMVVRILEGVGEGVTFPAMHAVLAKWAPPLERSIMGTFIYSGSQMGTVLSMPLSGVVSEYLGWEWVFYIFGILGCAWFFLYVFTVYDTPAHHPRISHAEKLYIETAIGKRHQKQVAVPWFSMFTSIPFWALLIAHTCYNWGFYTLLTSLPKYMNEILHYELTENGFLSSLPYIMMWLCVILSGHLADRIRSNQILSTTNTRKLFNTIGLLGGALTLLVVSFLGCNRTAATTMLVLGSGLCGFSQSGYQVNHLDLAPAYAGTMMGITNSVANIPGFLSPEVVGWLTKAHPGQDGWRSVFYIGATIYTVGAAVFLFFGSGEKQPWAEPLQHSRSNSTTQSGVHEIQEDKDD